MPKKNTRQVRRFVLTLWDTDLTPKELPEWMSWFIGGLETCPKTNKLHWQAYCETHTKRTEAGVAVLLRKLGFKDNFVAEANASNEAQIEYCKGLVEKKDENAVYFELGKPMTQGERVDLETMRDRLLKGDDLDDMILEKPIAYHQYGRTMEKLAEIAKRRQDRRELRVAEWRYGPSGCGKSYLARSKGCYEWNFDEKYQTYQNQNVILFDEMRPGIMKLQDVLRYTDKDAKLSIPIKFGSAVPFNVSEVYFTSPLHPTQVFEFSDNDSYKQFERRINVVHCDTPYTPPGVLNGGMV